MKKLNTKNLPYEWMKKDLGLTGGDLVLFAAICENRCGLLEGVARPPVVAKALDMGESTYFLARKNLIGAGLIRLVKMPGGSLIRLTDKSLVLAEKDPRLDTLCVAGARRAAPTADSDAGQTSPTERAGVSAVLSSLADFLTVAKASVSLILAHLSGPGTPRKSDDASAPKKENDD